MSTTVTNVTIIGGHGQVAIRLAALLASSTNKTYAITPVIRNPAHAASLIDLPTVLPNSITPLVLSLEDEPVSTFTAAFVASKADVVVFSAGANSEGERTKKVDYEGAVKIFDAIEGVAQAGGKAPRLILVSALDVRNPDVTPDHYTEDDIKASAHIRSLIPVYYQWKYEGDKELVKRDAFEWTILRPGLLSDKPGTGKANIGRTHLLPEIARDDVALTLRYLVNRPDAAGLAIDMVGGEEPVEAGLDAFIRKGETDFLG